MQRGNLVALFCDVGMTIKSAEKKNFLNLDIFNEGKGTHSDFYLGDCFHSDKDTLIMKG